MNCSFILKGKALPSKNRRKGGFVFLESLWKVNELLKGHSLAKLNRQGYMYLKGESRMLATPDSHAEENSAA